MARPSELAGAIPAPILIAPPKIALRFQLPLPEILLALLFMLAGLAISQAFGLPVSLPSAQSLAFTGLGNIVPLVVVPAGVLITLLTQRASRTLYFAVTLLAYGAILITHFNIKLWVHSINPGQWDAVFWRMDTLCRPLVTGALAIHRDLATLPVPIDRLYLFAFLAMFVCSLVVHSSRAFPVFRKVVLTAMIVHVLGGLSYLLMPALGPFLFEPGANAIETQRQAYMLAAYHQALPGGIDWYRTHGAEFLATGLAAMPSLHVASSAVFVYYAWRYERRLCWLYFPLFAFIMVEAVATRWHYVVDVAAGLGLTALAILIVEQSFARWFPDIEGNDFRRH